MKRAVAVLLFFAGLAAPGAAAHPLGNFTVNRYAAVEASGRALYVHYVVDLAEIPTLQDGKRLRRTDFARAFAARLRLEVDGRRIPLRPLESNATERPGAGGLKTLRLEALYAARAGRHLELHDRNFAGRIGWREVVVRGARGATVLASSAPSTSISGGLRRYPADLLREPLAVSSATATIRPGTLPGDPPALGSAPMPTRDAGGFEALISRDYGLGTAILALLIAAFWGAAHALTPGHGKAIVAAYLVGTRGNARHALALGGIVTVTHTIGVFALGIVTLALSEFFLPEDLYPWLTLVSALLVVGVGVTVLRQRLRRHHHHHHHHERRGLLALGISGGLLPCPTALVVLLAAISLHRVALGLLLIVAFSLGLASVITGIGLLAVSAKRVFSRLDLDGALVRALPAVSAAAIVAVGLVMTARALPTVT
jgi:ABC-type nickel/cobalt efflux system permease component RcnA